ncbi:parathyroid hormone-like [Nerophis ophidion]|uniref:parathyroid hormone-like n=1 Tax=Nerophis ophidion TaxID=159077 RepID=UPI002AE0A2EC|nr:parathyroid hormone-like [Nerophis ophidion]
MRSSVLVIVCISQIFTVAEGGPLRKRTVSEVQLMHDHGELKQVQQRRDWLQVRLRGLHTAPWTRRRFLLEELGGLTAEEIQEALDVFDKLLNPKPS